LPIQLHPGRPGGCPRAVAGPAHLLTRARAGTAGRPASAGGLAGDPRHDLARDQLNLAALVTHRPEMDPLAAGLGVAGQQLRALVRRANTDPPAKLRRVPPD